MNYLSRYRNKHCASREILTTKLPVTGRIYESLAYKRFHNILLFPRIKIKKLIFRRNVFFGKLKLIKSGYFCYENIFIRTVIFSYGSSFYNDDYMTKFIWNLLPISLMMGLIQSIS